MKNITIKIILLVLCIIFLIPNFVCAKEKQYDIKTGDYDVIYKDESKETTKVADMGGKILGVVQMIGISIGTIMLLIIGIKYMWMSSNPGDKASIKEKLIPYVIGALIMFGGTGILSIIANFARTM